MTEAELTAAYEADIHARGQKTIAEMEISAEVLATTNAELIHELRQIAEWSYDERDRPRDFIRLAALRLEALNRPSEGLCGDLRIATVALREAGYPTGTNACISATVRLETRREISEETLDEAFGAYFRAYDENNHMPHRTALRAALEAARKGEG